MELAVQRHFRGQKYRQIRTKTNLWRVGSTVDQIQLKQVDGCWVSYPKAKSLCVSFLFISFPMSLQLFIIKEKITDKMGL